MQIKLLQLISELSINNPNSTAEQVWNYFVENIFNSDFYNRNNKVWIKYMDICQPYMEKYTIIGFVGTYNDFLKFSQSDLNKFYKQMKQLVQKYSNINELTINKPSRTYDVREENWLNLSSAIFDKIEIGDKIIDPEFIGIVYKKEWDHLLGLMCIEYKDGMGNAKFLSRDWFKEVSS